MKRARLICMTGLLAVVVGCGKAENAAQERSTAGGPAAQQQPSLLRLKTRRVCGLTLSEDWRSRRYFVNCNGELLIKQGVAGYRFRNMGDEAQLDEAFGLDVPEDEQGLPVLLWQHVAMLRRMGIPDETTVNVRFRYGASGDEKVCRITRDEDWHVARLKPGGAWGIEIGTAYWIEMVTKDERAIPVCHFFDGTEHTWQYVDYGISYYRPFGVTGLCNFTSFWSQFFDDDSRRLAALNDFDLWFRDDKATRSENVTLPAKGMMFEGWVYGFDGSVSVILLDQGELVWHHITTAPD